MNSIDIEQQVFRLHEQINARGVCIDRELAEGAVCIIRQMKMRARAELRRLTGLQDADRPQVFANWLTNRVGKRVTSVSNDNLQELARKVKDDNVLAAIRCRQILGRTSYSKYDAIVRNVDADGRLRNMYVYQGAHTGRWSSTGVQLHNLPRAGRWTDLQELETAVSIVRTGDYSAAYMSYGDDLPAVMASLIRACFTAPEDRILAVADFSAIEARVLAWLAGEEWKLEVFGTTGKIYEATAAKMFGIPVEAVTKEQRDKGKVSELSLGFGGGTGALRRQKGGDALGFQEAANMVEAWRKANPRIVRLWVQVEEAARRIQPGEDIMLGKIRMSMRNGTLIVSLPSGRELAYPDLRGGERLSYTMDGVRKDLYGGKLVENIVQAIARDIQASAMLRVAGEGDYDIVMHTHDELVAEIDNVTRLLTPELHDWDIDEIVRRMEVVPEWAAGLPLKVEGFVTRHYTK